MSARGGINLARRPFVNARPVRRVTLLLWTLGALLAIAAAWSYWVYFAGREDQRREIAILAEAMAAERTEIAELQTRLAAFELDGQNERVRFLNQRIAERTFSWSLLFDRLAAILPGDVRLQSLAPEVGFGESSDRSRRTARTNRGAEASLAALPGELVPLTVVATARREEAVLELLDALFSSPLFERPNLAQESRERAGGETRFALSVVYLPLVEAPGAEAVPGTGDLDGPHQPDLPAGRAGGSGLPAGVAATEAAGREDPT